MERGGFIDTIIYTDEVSQGYVPDRRWKRFICQAGKRGFLDPPLHRRSRTRLFHEFWVKPEVDCVEMRKFVKVKQRGLGQFQSFAIYAQMEINANIKLDRMLWIYLFRIPTVVNGEFPAGCSFLKRYLSNLLNHRLLSWTCTPPSIWTSVPGRTI